MIGRPRASHIVIGTAWLAAAASLVPVAKALRGDFRVEAPAIAAKGVLTPLASSASPIRLDTATLVVLVYSATCPACQANTDNWLRLRATLREQNPGLPVVVIPAPQDSMVRPELPEALRNAFPEYRLTSGTVRDLGIEVLPATIFVERGRVVSITNGIVGPHRRDRFAATVRTEDR
jgi:hypothetical protein